MNKTLLTIDFDFFITESMLMDISHKESSFFIKDIWMTRSHLMDHLKCSDDLKNFCFKLSDVIDISDVDICHVSESHCYAANLCNDVKDIILFDAHHDCWPLDSSNHIECQNWITWHLKNNPRDATVYWVYPDHVDPDYYSTPVTGSNAIMYYSYSEFLEKAINWGADKLHICRSGAWTPPWCDDEFIDLVDSFNLPIVGLGDEYSDHYIDPLERRWNKHHYKQAQKMAEFMTKSRQGDSLSPPIQINSRGI